MNLPGLTGTLRTTFSIGKGSLKRTFEAVVEGLRFTTKIIADGGIRVPAGMPLEADGIVIVGVITVARPVGTMVLNSADWQIYRSTNAGVPLYIKVTNTGGGGGGGNLLKDANLSAQVTGATNSFTLPEAYIAGTLWVFWNGQKLTRGTEYNETSSTTFDTTFTPGSGQDLTVAYQV